MREGGYVRSLLLLMAVLGLAGCNYYDLSVWSLPPGQLTLSNYRFDHAPIEAMMVAGPDCTPVEGAAPTDFDLPFKGTRVLVAAPRSDICWRRQLADGRWTDWNRAFTATGRFVDAQL